MNKFYHTSIEHRKRLSCQARPGREPPGRGGIIESSRSVKMTSAANMLHHCHPISRVKTVTLRLARRRSRARAGPPRLLDFRKARAAAAQARARPARARAALPYSDRLEKHDQVNPRNVKSSSSRLRHRAGPPRTVLTLPRRPCRSRRRPRPGGPAPAKTPSELPCKLGT